MNGTEIISRLKHLGDVSCAKDIKQLTAALFPGAHCPLMGAMMAVGGIEDAVLLVLGTDECAYYTKKATIGGFSFEGIDNRCFSVVLDHHDVTFGCREKLQAAFKELMEDIAPKAVFLVTTCVLEVTGDDVDSMAEELETQYRIPVLPVPYILAQIRERRRRSARMQAAVFSSYSLHNLAYKLQQCIHQRQCQP